MTPFAELFTTILSLLALAGLLLAAFLICLRYKPKFFPMKVQIFFADIVEEYGILFAFITSLFGVIGSLFYSNVFGFTPCTLCWWARIFLYPQTVILLLALIRKDAQAKIYCLVLSGLGVLVTLYHSYIQLGGSSLLPCAATPGGTGGGCQVRYFLDFGIVTLPFMGLVTFLMIIAFLINTENKSN